jgi:hypothetical protein
MATNNTKAPEKDIVSFNQALELCSIGYDEPTFCMYEIENRQLCLCHIDEEGLYMPDKDLHAPTKGQVFRWFREKYNLKSCIMFRHSMEDDKEYYDWLILGQEVIYRHFITYKEAENACIDKLISIAKQ